MTQKLYIILGKADDNDEEILLKSGYMSEYQPTRHLWTPLNIDENETLTLECQSDSCYAILTFTNIGSNGNETCLKRGK